MEEDIKYLQRFIDKCKLRGYEFYGILHPPHFEMLQNLINKYKELEKERDDIYEDYQDLGKEKLKLEEKCEEQEKVIELMNEYILNEWISPEICSKHTPEDCYADIYDENACRNCILEYFRKKVKGE